MATLILQCKKREDSLLAEKLETWKQRANYAAMTPAYVIGSKYVRTSSEKIRDNVSANKSEHEESLLLVDDGIQNLLTNLRVPN